MFPGNSHHDSTIDFPLVGEPKYSPISNEICLEFNFGDIVYRVPRNVMFYIADYKAYGEEYGWQPPQDFINRVMRGGEITFSALGAEQFRLPYQCIGYLTRDAQGIYDSHYGGNDWHDGGTAAVLGPVPEGFIEQMDMLVRKAEEHAKRSFDLRAQESALICSPHHQDNDANRFTLPAVPGWENVAIEPPEQKLIYYRLMRRLYHESQDRMGIPLSQRGFVSGLTKDEWLRDKSHICASGLSFFVLNDGSALTRVDHSTFYPSSHDFGPEFDAELHGRVREHLAEIGIGTDLMEAPFIKVSGSDLQRLRQMKPALFDTGDFEQKLSLMTGARIRYAERTDDGFRVVGKDHMQVRQRYIGGLSGDESLHFKETVGPLLTPDLQGQTRGKGWTVYDADPGVADRFEALVAQDFNQNHWAGQMGQRLSGTPEEHFRRAQDLARELLAGRVPQVAISKPLPVTDEIAFHLAEAGLEKGWTALAAALGERSEGFLQKLHNTEAMRHAATALEAAGVAPTGLEPDPTGEKSPRLETAIIADRSRLTNVLTALGKAGLAPDAIETGMLEAGLRSAGTMVAVGNQRNGPAR